MGVYRITDPISGRVFGEYIANTIDEALKVLANDSQYSDDDAEESGELRVELVPYSGNVTFDAMTSRPEKPKK